MLVYGSFLVVENELIICKKVCSKNKLTSKYLTGKIDSKKNFLETLNFTDLGKYAVCYNKVLSKLIMLKLIKEAAIKNNTRFQSEKQNTNEL